MGHNWLVHGSSTAPHWLIIGSSLAHHWLILGSSSAQPWLILGSSVEHLVLCLNIAWARWLWRRTCCPLPKTLLGRIEVGDEKTVRRRRDCLVPRGMVDLARNNLSSATKTLGQGGFGDGQLVRCQTLLGRMGLVARSKLDLAKNNQSSARIVVWGKLALVTDKLSAAETLCLAACSAEPHMATDH